MNNFENQNEIDELSIKTIRILCAEVVEKANSGHPGTPLGIAPTAYTLWSKFMNVNPENPTWDARDRFVLSAGHASSLLYVLLHLFGYDVSMDDLKSFRKLGSKTPGHPEYGHTPGVEVTTGPLGQGIANAVGMAIAEKYMASKFNTDDIKIIDNYTYVICGDGCLMEGISSEAASLAGTLGLGKLILIYDSNNISIEGDTSIAFRENVRKRFEAFDWHTQLVSDGNDITGISKAIEEAKKITDKPSIIEIKTIIGYGAPNKQGKAITHGNPLGADEIVCLKKNFNWNFDENFYVPSEIRENFASLLEDSKKKENEWNIKLAKYKESYPDMYKEYIYWKSGEFADILNNASYLDNNIDAASRASSEIILNKLSKLIPNLIGGSADLAPSTNTIMKERGDFSKETPEGSNMHFGIREHAMTAIASGMTLYGGLKVYVAGFFVFSDYMKPALRLSALMKLPVISVLTHDSIGVGEDGPTHEPIEQLAALRSIPNYTVIRPCDANEVAMAWYLAISRCKSPTALILSRQKLPLLKGTGKDALKGGYILRDSKDTKLILIATGSEVALAISVYDKLKDSGVNSRVVSMPSFEIFEEQSDEYKEMVLPKEINKRLGIEAASSFGWHKYIGLDGDMVSIDNFGASGSGDELFKNFGFTTENVLNRAKILLKK